MSKKRRSAAREIFRQQNLLEEERLDGSPPAEPVLYDMDGEYAEAEEFSMLERAPAPQQKVAADFAPPAPPPKPGAVPAPVTPSTSTRDRAKKEAPAMMDDFVTSEELQIERGGVQVRKTGFLWWKRVIVPPNAYVVHTRIGHDKPVTLGLGVSFGYNPRTDAYLIVPAAMQTIGVVSNCISREKQGINVLAYVQWQISDFSIAYRKLDFSDPQDPLGVVNAQLREQADAAVKDKISTMSIDEVLTDKAPIIEELTRRLIAVAEGRVQGGENGTGDLEGLGIKIVTVQLREALVSSQRLWENLQAPFRHQQEQNARISQLNVQQEIQRRERESYQAKETGDAETRVNIAQVQQVKETEEQQLRLEEERKRSDLARQNALTHAQAEAEAAAQMKALEIQRQLQEAAEERRLAEERVQLEQARLQHEATIHQAQFEYEQALQQQQAALQTDALTAELDHEALRSERELEIERRLQQARHEQAQQAAAIARLEQEVRNLANERALLQTWIENLPELAESLPEIEHLNVLQMGEGQDDRLSGFVAQQFALIRSLRQFLNDAPPPDET